ncbi:MAG: hypothetical protein HFE59_11360 [Clostridiales bacterium]|nr:hypothetical protein [Clostridiales bacterium]
MKKNLKTIAMYLPQFHQLPENDEWWGKGFTEWTAVRSAEKLFEDHNQIREPFNDNYYNLLNKKTMMWQAELAKEYGVYGFCFYHYYFEKGRKILEKPMENLLKWKDIDIHFCFSWANQSWARTWSKIGNKNAWSEKFENENDNLTGVLLRQAYGQEKEWIDHFKYLLSFFKDERYIKIDNKPILVIYKPDEISVLSLMLKCWNQLAVSEGFSGIYSIGTNSFANDDVDAVLLQGPDAYRDIKITGEIVEAERINRIECYDYKKIWENAVNCKLYNNSKIYFGGFVDYDDTPRRGKLGRILKGVSLQVFEKYAYQLAVKNLVYGNEYFFINAWNEWGEGNYLEPDKKNGYAYLEALKRVDEKCNSLDFNYMKEWRIINNQESQQKDTKREAKLLEEVNRYQKCYYLLDRWMMLREKGIRLEAYFQKNNYNKVTIYGFAAIGKHLYEELKTSSVEVVCAIDRRQGLDNKDIQIISSEGTIPDCDVIVVTTIRGAERIVEEMQRQSGKKVVTLWEMINLLETNYKEI